MNLQYNKCVVEYYKYIRKYIIECKKEKNYESKTKENYEYCILHSIFNGFVMWL